MAASFRANRARLRCLAVPAVLVECWWLCAQLLALDAFRARTGLLIGVAAWLAWVRWQLGADAFGWSLRLVRLSRPARNVLLRSVALFVGSLAWQWATDRWLLSWKTLLLTRGGSGWSAVAWHRVFLLVIWVPLVEEVAFRAIMPRLIRARVPNLSRVAVALASGVVFSTYHLCNMVISEQPALYVAMQCVVALTAGCASALHVSADGESQS